MITPASINLRRLKKDQIIWLYEHYCKHRMRYITHPACYLSEKPSAGPIIEKIGFLDIETSNLSATFGYIFSFCIKELDGPMLCRVIAPEDIRRATFDKNIIRHLCNDLRKYDRIITYYGKDRRFDIPYCRTRAIYYGFDFPHYKELIVNDLYDLVKNKLKLHANRLQNACEFFNIPCKAHRLDPGRWQRAMAGDKASLDFILEHNKEDAIATEALWKKMQAYSRHPDTTI